MAFNGTNGPFHSANLTWESVLASAVPGFPAYTFQNVLGATKIDASAPISPDEIPTTIGAVWGDTVDTFMRVSWPVIAQVMNGGGGGGGGGVANPSGTGTDNAVVRFDGNGQTIQNSGVTIDDGANVGGIANLTVSGNITLSTGGATVDGVDISGHAAAANPHNTTLAHVVPGIAAALQVPRRNASNTAFEWATLAGGGNVSNAGTGTDNALARFDANGQTVQNSGVILDDSNNVSGIAILSASNLSVSGHISVSGNVDGVDISAHAAATNPHNTTLADVVPGSASANQVPRRNAGNTAFEWYTPSAGSGDVVGPAGATDNALARFDTATGKLIQSSLASLDDAGALTGLTGLTLATGNIVLSQAGATVDGVDLTAQATTIAGKVTGPATSTDNAVVRFDAATGKLVKNSGVIIDGSNNVTGVAAISCTSATISGNLAVTGTVDGRDVSVDGANLDAHVGSVARHLPASLGTANQQLRVNAGGTAPEWFSAGGGSGDVVGPAGGVADAELALFDATTGKLIKGSGGAKFDTFSGRFTVPSPLVAHGSTHLGGGSFYVAAQRAGDQDVDPMIFLDNSIGGGTNGASIKLFSGTRNPHSNVSSSNGFYFRSAGVDSGLFLKRSASNDANWRELLHVTAASTTRLTTAVKSGTSVVDVEYNGNLAGYINGLRISSTNANDVVVEVGACTDETGGYQLKRASSSTLTLGPSIVDNGATPVATTTYYVWLFGKSTGSNGDTVAKISTSASSPIYPAGYDIRRRIGSVRALTATTYYRFHQSGVGNERRVMWTGDTQSAPYLLLSGGTQTVWTTMTNHCQAPITASEVILFSAQSASGVTCFMRHADHSTATNGTARSLGSAGGMVSVAMPPKTAHADTILQYKISGAGSATIYALGFVESV
jgi:hypothetical protein